VRLDFLLPSALDALEDVMVRYCYTRVLDVHAMDWRKDRRLGLGATGLVKEELRVVLD
jgi:hypothetical protein